MEIPVNQLPPGDPRLVDAIVSQLKSKGIFDKFRKECLADVDTKPAFLNLRTRLDGQVKNFLSTQKWKNETNKNQLRENVRKNIQDSKILDSGVDAIVNQVVHPKIKPLILPLVEETVYNFLQIEKPKRELEENKFYMQPTPAFEQQPFYSEQSDRLPQQYPPYPMYRDAPPPANPPYSAPYYGQDEAMPFKMGMNVEHEPPQAIAPACQVKPEERPLKEESLSVSCPASDAMPMETDAISSEEDDILDRLSPVTSKPPEVDKSIFDSIKMESDNAVDSFDGALKEADKMTSAVQKMSIDDKNTQYTAEGDTGDNSEKPIDSITQPVFDQRSLDSISSNTSGLSLNVLDTEIKDSTTDVQEQSDSNIQEKSTKSGQSTPLIDEHLCQAESISSAESETWESTNLDTMMKHDTSKSLSSSLKFDPSKYMEGTSPISADSQESIDESSLKESKEKTEISKKTPKDDKSEGEITSSSTTSSPSDHHQFGPEKECLPYHEKSSSIKEIGSTSEERKASTSNPVIDEHLSEKGKKDHYDSKERRHDSNSKSKRDHDQRGSSKDRHRDSKKHSTDHDSRKSSKSKSDDHSSYRDSKHKHRRDHDDDDKDRRGGRDSHSSNRTSTSSKSHDKSEKSHEKSSHSHSHSKSHSHRTHSTYKSHSRSSTKSPSESKHDSKRYDEDKQSHNKNSSEKSKEGYSKKSSEYSHSKMKKDLEVRDKKIEKSPTHQNTRTHESTNNKKEKSKSQGTVKTLKEDNMFEMHLSNNKKDLILPKPNEKKLVAVSANVNDKCKIQETKLSLPLSSLPTSTTQPTPNSNISKEKMNKSDEKIHYQENVKAKINQNNKENTDAKESFNTEKLKQFIKSKKSPTTAAATTPEKDLQKTHKKSTEKEKIVKKREPILKKSLKATTNCLREAPTSSSPVLKKVTIPLMNIRDTYDLTKGLVEETGEMNSNEIVDCHSNCLSPSHFSFPLNVKNCFNSSDDESDFEGFTSLSKPKPMKKLKKTVKKSKKAENSVSPKKPPISISPSQLVVLCDSSDSSDMEVSLVQYCQKSKNVSQSTESQEDNVSHLNDFEGFKNEDGFDGFSSAEIKLKNYLANNKEQAMVSDDALLFSSDEEIGDRAIVTFSSDSEAELGYQNTPFLGCQTPLSSYDPNCQFSSPVSQSIRLTTSNSDLKKPLKKRKLSTSISNDRSKKMKNQPAERFPVIEFVAKDTSMSSYSLLTPDDDRTSSREYELDLTEREASYSPLSPSSDTSAEESRGKNKIERDVVKATIDLR